LSEDDVTENAAIPSWHIPGPLQARILDHLTFLYSAEQATPVWQRLESILTDFHRRNPELASEDAVGPLTERDAILITYGDQFQEPGVPPLQTLHQVLTETLGRVVSGVHILPFFPYSSDDGFSVIDYTQVNPDFGTWEDVERLGQDFRLMFDAVVNHISRQSAWFQGFLLGDPTYADWFISFEPDAPTDWIPQVTRPRPWPLLTSVQTAAGEKLVWTTFSEDQIDLNYAHPPVLLEILEILLFYVEKAAQIIRLDAIAYLWKTIGTTSIHLEETHSVVKLMRAALDAVAPGAILITETNVPHEENISYFGEPVPETGRTDEAQLVYQFPLAPLVMHSLLTGNAQVLSRWAEGLETPEPRATFFNFAASHDGIGLMPARGLLSEAEIQALVDTALAHGGRLGLKTNPDGSQSVYELNISYFDALSDPAGGEPLAVQVARFICSQAIMLALAGVPGIYVHSLLGSRSWPEGVARTGHNRTINRQKLERGKLERELADPDSVRHQVFAAYRRLLRARSSSVAFHPHGAQQVLLLNESVFALLRTAPECQGQVLCLHNVSDRSQQVQITPDDFDMRPGVWHDLLTGVTHTVSQEGLALDLPSFAVCWLRI
jgi:glycosidase